MARNQRVALRKHVEDIQRWVDDDKSDGWIASALGTTASSVQSFRSRNGIYRRAAESELLDPANYSSYEGVVEDGRAVWFDPAIADDMAYRRAWSDLEKIRVHVTPTRIILLPKQI